MNAPGAGDVVNFWLGDSVHTPEAAAVQRELWYDGGPEFDARIASEYGELVVQARNRDLNDWATEPEGALALVILLDQFTRNIYRGTAEVYSGDALAWSIADQAVTSGLDHALPVTGRIFLYHPFHHSEVLVEQNRGVALLEAMQATSPPQWKAYARRSVEGFSGHRDIVARFGRFPHRNRALNRANTPEEDTYLKSGGKTFGQDVPTPTA